MKPEEFVTEGMWVNILDYQVGEDGEIRALLKY
jgi:hypothetical protein